MLRTILIGFYEVLHDIFILLCWRDILELSIFFYAVYSFLLWVSKDGQQQLLFYCYAYSGLTALSYFLYLPVLYSLLIFFLPVCLVIFLLLHQKTLKKKAIGFYTDQSSEKAINNEAWQEIIIRAALIASNKRKNCFFVIEKNNSLSDYLEIPYFLEAEIHKDFFNFIIEAADNSEHIFLISNKIIRSIHSRWKILYTKESYEHSSKLSINESTGLVLSENIDCIILYTQQNKSGLNIIALGTLAQNLSAVQATNLLKQYYKNSMNDKGQNENRPLQDLK